MLPSCTSLELNGPVLRQEEKQGYMTSPKKGSKETRKILDFRLQEVSEASLVYLHQKQERVRAFVCHNDVDYRGYSGLDERLSVMPIDQADMYLSDKRAETRHCSRAARRLWRAAAGDGVMSDSWSLDCQLSTPSTSHESIRMLHIQ